MPELVPDEVLRSAIAGSTSSFRMIVEKHQAFAYAVAFRFVGNEEEAEDIVQEAFVRLWKNLKSYRADVMLTTWLYKIVTNLCLDYLKSKRGKGQKMHEDVSKGYFQKDDSTPEKIVEQQEIMKVIQSAAEELTPKQKAVFILKDLEGLTTAEVKEIMSMSEANIKSNLFHARQKVAERLKSIYNTTGKALMS